jgi:hypothetical protein
LTLNLGVLLVGLLLVGDFGGLELSQGRSLLLAAGLEEGGAEGRTSTGLENGVSALGQSIRVEANHGTQVGKRVALEGSTTDTTLSRTKLGLDFIGVDETVQVGVEHDVAGQVVVLLGGGGTSPRTPGIVEVLEGRTSPDDETTQVTTRSKLKEIQTVNMAEFDTRQVAEGAGDTLILLVDDQRTTSHDVTTTTELTLTSTELLRVANLFDISRGADSLEKLVGDLGLGDGLSGIIDDQGNFRELFNTVTTGQNERGNGGGSESRGNGITLLVRVDLSVPTSPDLGGGEHATFTAHVTESTLTSAGGTTTRNTRNTGDGATGTPRFGGVTHTSVSLDGVGLTVVLVHGGVDEVNDIGADGGKHNGGELDLKRKNKNKKEKKRFRFE